MWLCFSKQGLTKADIAQLSSVPLTTPCPTEKTADTRKTNGSKVL